MTRLTPRRSLWVLATGLVMLAAGCGGGSAETPAATTTPTATRTSTPTQTPTPTRTSTQPSASVTGLLVVNQNVTASSGDALGAPPSEWKSQPDSASFDRALSNANWFVDGDAAHGLTAADGRFDIGSLQPGQHTLTVNKTLDGNLASIQFPFTVGDDGSAQVVAEVAWGQVRTTSTYVQDGAQVREVRGPYGNGSRLVTHDGRVSVLSDGNRTLTDADGNGQFDVEPCLNQGWSCSQDSDCGGDRICQCVTSCPSCDACSLPGVCVPKGTPPPYTCGTDGMCSQPGDHCMCVSSCAACDDCTRTVCAHGCGTVDIMAVTVSGPSQLVVGHQGQVSATAQLSDGSQIDVTYLVTWTSSAETVASIDSWGTVSALTVGTTDFTATLGTLTSAAWPVAVVARPTLQSIMVRNQMCFCGPIAISGPKSDAALPPCVLAPAAQTDILPVPNCGQVVQVGATLQFSAIGQFADGSYDDITKDVQWQLTPPEVGDVAAGVFTARQAGTTTLTAALAGIVSDPIDIRVVTQPTVVALSIYADNVVVAVANGAPVPGGVALPCLEAGPQADLCCCPGPLAADSSTPCGCGYSITVLQGDQLQFHATAQYDTGEWRDVTDQVTWRSSDSTTAGIDTSGAMTAARSGDAAIDAVLGDVTSNPVGVHIVDHATLQYLSIYQDGAYSSSVVAKGDQRFFKATGSYDVGFSRDVTKAATWHSSNDAVGGFDTPGVFAGRSAGTVQVWAELDGQQSNYVSLEVYEVSELDYCDPANVNRSVWSDDYNRVTLESDCATYAEPGVVTLRYTVTETQPHGGIFNPCLDLYAYQGSARVRTIREEGCGDPFLPAGAPGRDEAAVKYQLRAFWDLKDDAGNPVPPGTYTIYGRFYLYYDPVVKIAVTVLPSDQPAPTRIPTTTPGPVCTPPSCQSGEVFYCPGNCPGGCGTVCATPVPQPTADAEGVCFESPDACGARGFATLQSKCCTISQLSAPPLPFWWCPAEHFNSTTGQCSACSNSPCAGLPTPTPLPPTPPAPSPQATITYQLTDGSWIQHADPQLGAMPAPPEALSGMFQIARDQVMVSPNTLFSFTIEAIRLHSTSFTVDGKLGAISATTVSPGVSMKAIVSINGDPQIELSGQGSLDSSGSNLPIFHDLEITGGGYTVTISAAPTS